MATLSSQVISDNNNVENEIATILRLHDYDNKQDIVTHLLINGRQGLLDYKDDIIPKIFNTQFNTPDAQLILALKTYVRRLWQTQYESSCHWLIAFIQNYHDNKDPQLYDRILTRTAEYGKRFMKDCPILSIVLQFVLESMDEECILSTNTFDEAWETVTSEGMKSLAKYSKYVKEEVMSEELDKNQSTLFRALREYYRPRLGSMLRDHGMNGEEVDENMALDFLSEDGVEKGMENIRQSMVKSSSDVVAEKEDVVLVNTDSPAEKLWKLEVRRITVATTIKVYVKKTGELFDVPMSVVSTVEDVIKYVCENSVCHDTMDYNDYYLVSPEDDTVLENEQKVDEILVHSRDTLEFKLCMKASKRQQIMNLALMKCNERVKANTVADSKDKEITEPVEPQQNRLNMDADKTEEAVATNVSAKSDMFRSNSPPENTTDTPSNISRSVSFTGSSASLSQKQDLAYSYYELQKRIHDITERLIHDPTLREKASEKLNDINIVVCGAPRVGKSALINAICHQELAGTHPGLHACTKTMSSYHLAGSIDIGDEQANYQYTFWDTPGFESWDREAIRKYLKTIKTTPKSSIICMIYCASPGSFANAERLGWLLDECIKLHIFCALVCTNKWYPDRKRRDAVIDDFQHILQRHQTKTRDENGIAYFGNVGLCTSVDSVAFTDEQSGKKYEESGIDELILGIMESLDDDKLAQWCAVIFENKSFWKKLSGYSEQLQRIMNKLIHTQWNEN
ncbi:unnamed protein product [Adineta ricciae]|uniref:G domain-containing protein n=2 Tax=Adineta ricciae TaxID=249248 RepID=A0A814JNG1_ADIRI|nr:unnamed protein product [Adineta ricciae]